MDTGFQTHSLDLLRTFSLPRSSSLRGKAEEEAMMPKPKSPKTNVDEAETVDQGFLDYLIENHIAEDAIVNLVEGGCITFQDFQLLDKEILDDFSISKPIVSKKNLAMREELFSSRPAAEQAAMASKSSSTKHILDKQQISPAKRARRTKKTEAEELLDEENSEEEERPRRRTRKVSQVRSSSSMPPIAQAKVAGEVDPEFDSDESSSAEVCTDDDSGVFYDAVLTFVEGTSDKYYVLQVVEDAKGRFNAFFRWGRNGTKGQQQRYGPSRNRDEIVNVFEKKFQEKTGNSFARFARGKFKHLAGKYDCEVNVVADNVKSARQCLVEWEFETNVGEWVGFETDAGDQVEATYQAWKQNSGARTNLSQRTIVSGGQRYHINLINMNQTNLNTKRVRAIRRLNPTNYEF